jgi:hypothetical protein
MFGFIKKFFNQNSAPKFKVGEKVKCVDDRNHKLIYGKEYTILDVVKTNCCKVYCYDVGLIATETKYTSCNCGNTIQGRGIHWCGEFRFAPIISDEAKVESEVSNEVGDKVIEEVKKILETEHCMN